MKILIVMLALLATTACSGPDRFGAYTTSALPQPYATDAEVAAQAAAGTLPEAAASPQVVPVQGGAANSIRQFGGEVVFTIQIQEGFNNPLYQNRVQGRLINLPYSIQNGAGLDTVNRAGQLASEVWEAGFEAWVRSGGLRPTKITIATFDRGTSRWRDEIWLNSRRVAVCRVVEIKQFRLELEEGDPGIPLGDPYIRSECR